jgi:hypothetical protein
VVICTVVERGGDGDAFVIVIAAFAADGRMRIRKHGIVNNDYIR